MHGPERTLKRRTLVHAHFTNPTKQTTSLLRKSLHHFFLKR